MTIMAELINSMKTYLARSIPDIRITDVIEMIIIAVLIDKYRTRHHQSA